MAPIEGKYDKKGSCYYFTEIPIGYNTIMVYHKKYNEKGFQNNEGLPAELKFRLQDKQKVSYSFLKVPDSLYDEKKKKLVKNILFKDHYIEDPFKISISPKDPQDYADFKEFINKKIEELNLEIVLVNPYWEKNKIEKYPFDVVQKEGYPNITASNSKEIEAKYLLPLVSGLNNIDNTLFETHYSNKMKDVCFIFRKKDGTKFKRFNDPIIRKLKAEKVNVFSIILNKKNDNILSVSSSKNDFRIRDKLNREFNRKHAVDSSKIFFYDNNFRNHKKPFYLFKRKNVQNIIYEPSDAKQVPSFLMIKNDNNEIPKYLPHITNEGEAQQKIPLQDKSIGLGILDQYEYYSTVN
ncbi:hypothetical protein GGR22_002416 [Flavobacterium gossypii]|uniref:Uncharacterized protein n=1 Tax=Flavobacterium gossypii TaxID=1646119 RepID=A0ABR6DS27_9FLAO|nr:hypothetical protein [Flavobacterium gossypii]MBA9074249.1 hypothetical protein [Flavobacterium gossypii]